MAFCIGGETATEISVFIHKTYFPWVIKFTTIFAAFGLLGMYLKRVKALTVSNDKKVPGQETNEKEEPKE